MKEFEFIQECLNRVQEEILAELNATTIDAITDILAGAGVSNFLAELNATTIDAIACINTNRNFIGFEIDPDYYEIAEERIRKAKLDKLLEVKENA